MNKPTYRFVLPVGHTVILCECHYCFDFQRFQIDKMQMCSDYFTAAGHGRPSAFILEFV